MFADVRRKDIAELLDRIEDESGRPTADGVLKTFRAISKWVQQRDESYNPPLTAGMSRVPKGEGVASVSLPTMRYARSGVSPRDSTATLFGSRY